MTAVSLVEIGDDGEGPEGMAVSMVSFSVREMNFKCAFKMFLSGRFRKELGSLFIIRRRCGWGWKFRS